MPKFASIGAEREYWDGHDAIEVLGEEGWKVSEAGATKVNRFTWQKSEVGEQSSRIDSVIPINFYRSFLRQVHRWDQLSPDFFHSPGFVIRSFH
jgi:hypothetical protein